MKREKKLLTNVLPSLKIFKGIFPFKNPFYKFFLGCLVCSTTRFSVGHLAAPVKQRPLSASSHLVFSVCVGECNSWIGAIGYVRLKGDCPGLLPRKLPLSQSPRSTSCKLVRWSIASLRLIYCMTLVCFIAPLTTYLSAFPVSHTVFTGTELLYISVKAKIPFTGETLSCN